MKPTKPLLKWPAQGYLSHCKTFYFIKKKKIQIDPRWLLNTLSVDRSSMNQEREKVREVV